jgi:hypothetical protein
VAVQVGADQVAQMVTAVQAAAVVTQSAKKLAEQELLRKVTTAVMRLVLLFLVQAAAEAEHQQLAVMELHRLMVALVEMALHLLLPEHL